MTDAAADPATETFVAHRKLLFTVAYEMLGSAADAEDVLQETELYAADPRDPAAVLDDAKQRQTAVRSLLAKCVAPFPACVVSRRHSS